MKKYKNIILLVVINILIVISNFLIITDFSVKYLINNYDAPMYQRYILYFIGVGLALLLDLGLNYISVKMANKREKQNKYKYYKVIIVPTILTVIIGILLFAW